MSMATRCPVCGTAFRVQRAQLAARGGTVRCGKCGAVFDGIAGLEDEGEAEFALEPSPQMGLFDPSRRPQMSASKVIENAELPAFMEEFEPERRATWLWALLAALCVLALFAQAGYRYRAEIAAFVPESRAPMNALCDLLGCEVQLPRRPELMSIDSSDLQADPRKAGLIVLNAVIRNRARYPQDYPALELTLTDESDRPVLRRVLWPRDYLDAGRASQLIAEGLAAGGDSSLRLFFDSGSSRATGYRLYLFYPT